MHVISVKVTLILKEHVVENVLFCCSMILIDM